MFTSRLCRALLQRSIAEGEIQLLHMVFRLFTALIVLNGGSLLVWFLQSDHFVSSCFVVILNETLIFIPNRQAPV